MQEETREQLLLRLEDLERRVAEYDQLTEAVQTGQVDAFAINPNNQSEVYTLQSGDYAYRVLIEKFNEGAINVTEEGLIVYTNAYFFELLKLPYEKVIGSYISDFIHKDSLNAFEELFAQALKGNSKGEINLLVGTEIIPVYISLTSLYPKLETVGIIISDLSEKKKNEETILRYQKDLEIKNVELMQTNAELG